MENEEPLRTSSQSTPDHPASQGIRDDQCVPYRGGTADGVSKDVEHVVAVIGEGKGVNDGVVSNYDDREQDSRKEIEWPQDLGREDELRHLQRLRQTWRVLILVRA